MVSKLHRTILCSSFDVQMWLLVQITASVFIAIIKILNRHVCRLPFMHKVNERNVNGHLFLQCQLIIMLVSMIYLNMI